MADLQLNDIYFIENIGNGWLKSETPDSYVFQIISDKPIECKIDKADKDRVRNALDKPLKKLDAGHLFVTAYCFYEIDGLLKIGKIKRILPSLIQFENDDFAYRGDCFGYATKQDIDCLEYAISVVIG